MFDPNSEKCKECGGVELCKMLTLLAMVSAVVEITEDLEDGELIVEAAEILMMLELALEAQEEILAEDRQEEDYAVMLTNFGAIKVPVEDLQ